MWSRSLSLCKRDSREHLRDTWKVNALNYFITSSNLAFQKMHTDVSSSCCLSLLDSVPGHRRHDGRCPRRPFLRLYWNLPDGDERSSHLVPGQFDFPGLHLLPWRTGEPLAALHADWSSLRWMHFCLHQHHLPHDAGAKRGHPTAAPQGRPGDPETNSAPHPALLGCQLPPGSRASHLQQ